MPRIFKKAVRGLQLLFSREGRQVWGYRMRGLYFDLVVGIFRPTHISVRSPFGVRWILPAKDPTSRWIFSEPDFDRAGMQACLDLIRPGDVVVDGGANFGLYSKLFSRAVGERGVVIAVEPFEHTARTLQRQLCAAPPGRVKIVQKPLWSREMQLELIARQNNGEDCQRVRRDGEDLPCGTQAYRSRTATLDGILSRLGGLTPSLVKLDVEGSEQEALKGACQTLGSPSPPWLYVEINPPLLKVHGATEREFMAWMGEEYGYRFAIFDGVGWRRAGINQVMERLECGYVNLLAEPATGKFSARGDSLRL